MSLTDIEYRFIAELSANAGRVFSYQHLQGRVRGADENRGVRPIRTVVNSNRRKLGNNAKNRLKSRPSIASATACPGQMGLRAGNDETGRRYGWWATVLRRCGVPGGRIE